MRWTLARRLSAVLAVAACAAAAGCRTTDASPRRYLYVWAGDSAGKASDFLAVIDADPNSANYGAVVTSLVTGQMGTHPHHTEAEMPANGHLLANGFHAGRTWLFDLTTPTAPKILTTFDAVGGFAFPHTYTRLANGNVLATFQYAADSSAPAPSHTPGAEHDAAMAAQPTVTHRTGGLVEMDERGTLIRAQSAHDPAIADSLIYPYSVLALPTVDRAVSTTTDMDAGNKASTAEWVQFWRLSDLTLLRSVALPPGPRGDEHKFTGEPHLLPDGKGVYIHTFNCGLYLIPDPAAANPTASFVHGFDGVDCGVPILTGHYWLQPVPAAHAIVALDITDPAHPREMSRVSVGADENPHWLAIDETGRRVVLNSGGSRGNRLFVIDFDPATGVLAIDKRFRDKESDQPGVRMTGKSWPHGFSGTAYPHGTVFSR